MIARRERRKRLIADYDPTWPARFGRERSRVSDGLRAASVRIEHLVSWPLSLVSDLRDEAVLRRGDRRGTARSLERGRSQCHGPSSTLMQLLEMIVGFARDAEVSHPF